MQNGKCLRSLSAAYRPLLTECLCRVYGSEPPPTNGAKPQLRLFLTLKIDRRGRIVRPQSALRYNPPTSFGICGR